MRGSPASDLRRSPARELGRRRDELVLQVHRADTAASVLAEASTRLGRLVPFDAAVWFMTDPATGLPVAPTRIENVPDEGTGFCSTVWRWEFMSRDVNLLRDLARAHVPAAGLRATSAGRPEQSRRYHRVIQAMGLDDELRTVLRVGDSPWGAALLYRRPGRPPFSGREIAVMANLSAPLAEALRNRSRSADRARYPSGEGPHAPGLLLFGLDATLISVDRQAAWWLEQLPTSPPTVPTDLGLPLPTWLQAISLRAASAAAGHGDGTARARLRTRTGLWLVCHAACLRDADGHATQVAAVIEPATRTEIAPIVTEAYELTEREQQITRLVARGARTRDIAEQLHLSAHTVRDYLKTIFRKVQVGSRGELVAKLYAEHYEPLHDSEVTRLTVPSPDPRCFTRGTGRRP
jgi:DNA-binding CsgD family transcriptional regulator